MGFSPSSKHVLTCQNVNLFNIHYSELSNTSYFSWYIPLQFFLCIVKAPHAGTVHP